MDLNDLCITLVLVNCVWLLAMRPARLWWIKIAAVLVLLGVTWLWRPDRAGYYAVGPWALLVMLPLWLQNGALYLLHQRCLRAASWLSSALVFLHPSASARSMRKMSEVLRRMYRGEVAAGLELAKGYGILDPGLSHLGMVIEAQMTGDWAKFENDLKQSQLSSLHEPVLLLGQLVATAQRGEWEEFKGLCHEVGQARFAPDMNASLNLRAFALLGDLAAVRNVCASCSRMIPYENREYWTAVAEQISGAGPVARQRLNRLLPGASSIMRPMIERQLASPLPGPTDASLRKQSLEELRSVLSVVSHDARYAILSGGTDRWPWMTLALMAVLVAIFIQEIPGGSESTENLERMGAMVVPLTGVPGEWKNAFIAGLLHFGPVHLTLNLVGLLFLGRLVERAWGRLGLLLLFLLCNVTSAALLPWLTFQPPDESSVFAGASGGIMGLLGGLWGQLLVGWLKRKTPMLRSQFQTTSTVVLAQCVCDVMTPQVSMTCHMIGFVTGVLVGIVVGLRGGRRVDAAPI
ncbi:MAG: rhomboid family intramembrane serine protease [Planctomycetaceae bacterium]